MASFLPDTDSEDELPVGWEERATMDGQVFYANHNTETTQWTHPKTGKRKKVAGELPFGWEKTVQDDGTIVYVDHINKKTTYTDPRLAFATEEKETPDDFRQQFDSSSTALQVLHGRDLSSKVAIVTGASDGIGYETTRGLAYHGAHVILACRDVEKSKSAMERITNERSHVKLTLLHCDLSCLKSVKKFADDFIALNLPLHMLILNAGVFALPHELTSDGLERSFQVNHVGHFYLTKLLQHVLVKSAPSRVVTVSSESHRFSFLTNENISKEYLSPKDARSFTPMIAYNDTKLCNVLFSMELNKRLSKYGVYCNSLHPGNMMSTGISRNWWFYRLMFALVRPFTKSAEQGAATTVYVATSLALDKVGGLYFNNCCRCSPSKSAQDSKLALALWNLTDTIIQESEEKDSPQEESRS